MNLKASTSLLSLLVVPIPPDTAASNSPLSYLIGNYYPVSRNRFLYMIMINGYETQGKPWILIPGKALAN